MHAGARFFPLGYGWVVVGSRRLRQGLVWCFRLATETRHRLGSQTFVVAILIAKTMRVTMIHFHFDHRDCTAVHSSTILNPCFDRDNGIVEP